MKFQSADLCVDGILEIWEVIVMGDNQRWDVGDPIGTGNDIGAPEVPYMNYSSVIIENEEEKRILQEKEEEEIKNAESKYRSDRLSSEAWKLYEEKRYEEALVFINRALEYWDEVANTWNRKALILENLKEYEEALSCYETAIGLDSEEIFKHNKAVCLIDYCYILKDDERNEDGLGKINEALDIFQMIDNRRYEDEAWNLKGIFLEMSADIAGAFNCYKRALGMAEDDSNLKQTYLKNRDSLLQYIANVDIDCPKCGERLRITDSYCFKCRTPIDESVEIVLRNPPDSGEERKMTVEYDPVCDADIIHFDDE